MTLYLDRAVSRAIDELPREISYAATRFIDDIGDLSSILFSLAPLVTLEANQDKLGKVVSKMVRSDILLRDAERKGKLDLPSFILEADDLSDRTATLFAECFPKVARSNDNLLEAVGSAAMGLVGLHGVLLFPDPLILTIQDDNYGAAPFMRAVNGMRDEVLKPMAKQIRS